MPELVVEKYLNYSKPIDPSNIGRLLGPDTEGRVYQIEEIDGTQVTARWRPGGPKLPLPDANS